MTLNKRKDEKREKGKGKREHHHEKEGRIKMGEELVEGRRGSWEEKGRRKGGRGQPKDRGRRGEKRRARGCFHKNPPAHSVVGQGHNQHASHGQSCNINK